ncbi:MAG: potassium-transporting ATPase subunit KdpC [Gemmatimonadota bacterium]
MLTDLRAAALTLALLTAVTGVAYPLLVTGIAATAFPSQAHGSLLVRGDTVRGSALVGQAFTAPRYLHGRPSAIASPYDARTSSGSNLGPGNPALDSLVRARVAELRAAVDLAGRTIPVDLITASASGLDPHLSPAAAVLQVPRIAQARQLQPDRILQLIRRHIEPRTFGVLGEPRVNVLRVNLALDSLSTSSDPSRP